MGAESSAGASLKHLLGGGAPAAAPPQDETAGCVAVMAAVNCSSPDTRLALATASWSSVSTLSVTAERSPRARLAEGSRGEITVGWAGVVVEVVVVVVVIVGALCVVGWRRKQPR